MAERGRHKIELADNAHKYEGLRALWCEVFSDEPGFVDALYKTFGAGPDEGLFCSEEIKGYVIADEDDRIISSLTCFRCGKYEGKPVYTSYAICTAPAARGLGLAGSLVEHVKEKVLAEGGVSLISPAETSLEKFYAAHGYTPYFYVSEQSVISPELDDEEYEDFDEFDLDFGGQDRQVRERPRPVVDVRRLSSEDYHRRRESFLRGRPHVELSSSMLELAHSESLGGEGFLAINDDAICAISEADKERVLITELIVSPELLEISGDMESEIAGMLAEHFGSDEAVYSTPGAGRCQSMAAPGDLTAASGGCGASAAETAYYGFSID